VCEIFSPIVKTIETLLCAPPSLHTLRSCQIQYILGETENDLANILKLIY